MGLCNYFRARESVSWCSEREREKEALDVKDKVKERARGTESKILVLRDKVDEGRG